MTDHMSHISEGLTEGRAAGGPELYDLVSLIALTHSRMIRPFERSFARRFTGLQIMTLCMLMQSGPRSITDIASELYLSKQQTAKLIAKLHLLGCVRRFHPSDDHRVVLVELSEETARMMRSHRSSFYERLTERITEHGGPDAAARFNRAVEEIRQVLELLPADNVSGGAFREADAPPEQDPPDSPPRTDQADDAQ